MKIAKDSCDGDALLRAAHSIANICAVEIIDHSDSMWHVKAETDQEITKTELTRLVLGEIYDEQLREKVRLETKPIRDLIFAAAFSNIEIE